MGKIRTLKKDSVNDGDTQLGATAGYLFTIKSGNFGRAFDQKNPRSWHSWEMLGFVEVDFLLQYRPKSPLNHHFGIIVSTFSKHRFPSKSKDVPSYFFDICRRCELIATGTPLVVKGFY